MKFGLAPVPGAGAARTTRRIPGLVAPGRYRCGCTLSSAYSRPRLLSRCGPAPSNIFGRLTRAKEFTAQEVSLPINPYLTEPEIEHVVSTVNAWEG